jgi:phosphoribosylamine--glycine ligase/phosphoribosylformylglycinamidine cyclo-ligase
VRCGCVWEGPLQGFVCTDDYDLAGFAVGAVNRDGLLPLPNIQAGDSLVALSSNGPHSNGFSLIRKIVDASPLDYSSPAPWDHSKTLGEELLTPTTLYILQLLRVLRDPALKGAIKGLSNITGGGWVENIPRMLPKHLAASIDAAEYQLPPLFRWLQQHGNVAPLEMVRALNCGVGMVAVVEAGREEEVVRALNAAGPSRAFVFGTLVEGKGDCVVKGLERWQ